MNNIEHNFIDTVSAERILQWRATVLELIRVGFAVELKKKVQLAMDAIDACLEVLKKEVVDLVGVAGPIRFEDQTLISSL